MGLLLVVIGLVAVVEAELTNVSLWFVAAAIAALGISGLIKAMQQDDEADR